MKEEFKKIKRVLKKCKKERDEYLDGWKRTKADFINYKKEEIKRLNRFLEEERKDIILGVLPVLDNFKRAEEEVNKSKKKDDIIKGFLNIKEQMEKLLKREGVREIASVGEEFDPEIHEAIEMIEAEGESGMVAEEIEKGYELNERVIRPAKVKVIK